MDYKEIVETYEKIDSTTKRLDKTFYVSNLLKKTPDSEIERVILLLNGNLYPSWDKKEIGVASKIVIKSISLSAGVSISQTEQEWKKTGDLGIATTNLMRKKKQSVLFSQGLSVKKVFDDLRKLAETTGSGAVDQKTKIISGLLSSADPIEAKYITRTVLEDMRVGIGEGTIRDAIAWSSVKGLFIEFNPGDGKFDYKLSDELASSLDKNKHTNKSYQEITELIQSAYDIKNDFAQVIQILREKGITSLMEINISAGSPIKVMLYQKAKDIKDAFERVGRPAAFEYKYDGFRIQIHKKNGKITLFTRRLENVTDQFPDVVNAVAEQVKGDNFILDSEAVGYDPKTGKYLPFQSISQRIKRKYGIQEMARDYPVELNVFDIIAKEGKSMLKDKFEARRKAISSMIKEKEKSIIIAKQIITSDEKEAQKFYEEAIKAGEEGVMAKNLAGEYKPGSRVGYGVKVKPVMETLDLVIIGAEWGKGKREGWLSSFLIACQDDEGNLLEIGKVGTGIKELESEGPTFDKLTEILRPLVTEENKSEVRIRPKIVIEVNYEEIQKSPTYSSGYALRFPRVIQIREDKPVDEISTIDYVEDLYFGQK